MKWLFGMAGMACLLALSPAAHAQEIRTVPVRFAPGATSAVLQGAIAGRKSVSYTVGAEAGQTLKVRLKSSSPSISFNLYGPGRGPGEEALAIGDLLPETNRFEGKLDISGVYTVNVFLIRAAARRNARSNYTLEISIPGNTAAVPQEPVRNDFADGLQGGPDNWAVAGVPAGDVLQLRRGPSAKEASVASLANGAVLRNGGCQWSAGSVGARSRPQAPFRPVVGSPGAISSKAPRKPRRLTSQRHAASSPPSILQRNRPGSARPERGVARKARWWTRLPIWGDKASSPSPAASMPRAAISAFSPKSTRESCERSSIDPLMPDAGDNKLSADARIRPSRQIPRPSSLIL